MRKVHWLSFFFVFFLLFTLSTASSAKSLRISLREEMTLGHLDDDLIYMWVGIAVDESGHIYLTDTLDYSLKKFSPAGRLVKKAGGRGQGPGEFMAPREVQIFQNYVLVTDQNIRGIQVFDRDLNFIKRIPFSHLILDMRVCGPQAIALIPIVGVGAGRLKIIDFDGQEVSEFFYEKTKKMMLDFASICSDKEGNIYLVFTFQDRIEKYNLQGKKLWTNRLLKVKSVSKEKINRFEVPTRVVYKDVTLDPVGRVFVLGGHYSKHQSRDIYVLDTQGRYLTTFTLPEESHAIYIDQQGFLYSRGNDGVSLRKFKIIYQVD
ncbi:MAG: NHL repeat-containing protein [Candidatus Aminicenantes bacterium]|nr:NHL repeat-containing protein [Candidatus Aminicenantes bacterium]